MRNIILLLLGIFFLSSCKSDRFSHEDKNYLYYWRYDINGDSILCQFHKPRTVEYKVKGGGHKRKNREARIYVYGNSRDNRYEIVYLNSGDYPYEISRNIVDRAKEADWNNKILIGIFRETFYPSYKLEFIKYK